MKKPNVLTILMLAVGFCLLALLVWLNFHYPPTLPPVQPEPTPKMDVSERGSANE